MSLEQAVFNGLNNVAQALREIAVAIGAPRLPTPKPFTVRLISERKENDMDLLTYEATLPTVPPGTDVASQTLSVVVDGTAQADQELASDATTATFEVPQGSNVSLSLVYKDDGGNVSAPKTQDFVASDTIPPMAPGDFGAITLVSERTVP